MLNDERRTPMKRTPFKRASATTHESEQEREQRHIDKARRAMKSVVPRAANMGSATTAAAPIPKAAPVRSEAVRRELEPAWAADTQRSIKAMGLWPTNLPGEND